MRGRDQSSGNLFSYVDLEERVPDDHPLRLIREIVNDVLGSLSSEFETLYSDMGRPSNLFQSFRRGRNQMSFFGWARFVCLS